jgi:hypothetical protein
MMAFAQEKTAAPKGQRFLKIRKYWGINPGVL